MRPAEITKNIHIMRCDSLNEKKLSIERPATKKYMAVRKNAKKVVWFARWVRCIANFSLNIRSLFIVATSPILRIRKQNLN